MNAINKSDNLKMSKHKQKLKKMSLLMILIIGSFQANSQTYMIAAGSNIYEVDPLNCTETLLCTISVNTGGGTLTGDIADIAFHPNGNLYGIVSNYFISIDLGTCLSTTIATHSTSSNSLVASANGTLYAAYGDLYTVDPVTGVFTSIGTLPCQAGGDLAFEGGDLYLTCDNGDLIKVDINNPAASVVIGNLGAGFWYGLWTVYTDCNNTHVLAATQNELYEVDINTAITTYSCTLGTTWIGGGTMFGDFNASECGCSVDLGPDLDLCNGSVELNAADSNYTYLWSDGSTDSTITTSTAGIYYVNITDTTSGCTNSDTLNVIECDLGVSDLDISLMVFPNPSDGHIKVSLSEFMETTIIITDITGRMIYENSNSSEIKNLDLSHLNQGTYFLTLMKADGQVLISKKIELIK
ncbi:MAG: hypothetical protein ACJA1C_000892 [Crocinitomicaceae bacterium]|jgi:hypothetical protein